MIGRFARRSFGLRSNHVRRTVDDIERPFKDAHIALAFRLADPLRFGTSALGSVLKNVRDDTERP